MGGRQTSSSDGSSAAGPGTGAPAAEGPAVYRICIRGRLDPVRVRRFEGLNVTESPGRDGSVETILVGRLLDQADLAGALSALFELHMPVLSVECLSQG